MGVRRKAFNRKLNPGVYERSDGRYQARIAIPEDVQFAFRDDQGRPLQRRVLSLGTHDPDRANREHAKLLAKHETLFDSVRRGAASEEFASFLRHLYERELEQHDHWADLVATKQAEENPYLRTENAIALQSDDPPELIAVAGWAADSYLAETGNIKQAAISPALRATPSYISLVHRCAQVLRDAWRTGDEKRKGLAVSSPRHVPQPRSPTESRDGNRALDARGRLPLSRYFNEVYLPAKATEEALGGESTVKGKRDSLDLFVAHLGDRPLCLITRADITDFQGRLRQFPNRAKLAGDDAKLSVEEIVAALKSGTLTGVALTGAETINKHVRSVKAVLNAAKGKGHILINPGEGVPDVKPTSMNKAQARRGFTQAELQRIFDQPLFKGCKDASERGILRPGDKRVRDDRFWIPVLLFLTGARSTEIAGLEIQDVVIAADASRILIRPNSIRRLKNGWSERVIPIHSWALEMGFEQFVTRRSATKEQNLFAMVTRPEYRDKRTGHLTEDSLTKSPVMRQFYRTVLKHADIVRGETSVHSFRHTYESAMTFTISDPEVRSRLTGRAIDGSRATNYTTSFPKDLEGQGSYARELRTRVDGMNFGGLSLRHLYLTNHG